eukprot:scaffold8855_cov125-Isochrysis_galbana.AAC.4
MGERSEYICVAYYGMSDTECKPRVSCGKQRRKPAVNLASKRLRTEDAGPGGKLLPDHAGHGDHGEPAIVELLVLPVGPLPGGGIGPRALGLVAGQVEPEVARLVVTAQHADRARLRVGRAEVGLDPALGGPQHLRQEDGREQADAGGEVALSELVDGRTVNAGKDRVEGFLQQEPGRRHHCDAAAERVEEAERSGGARDGLDEGLATRREGNSGRGAGEHRGGRKHGPAKVLLERTCSEATCRLEAEEKE